MRRMLVVFGALVLAMAGCDAATGVDYTDPGDLAIAIVAGDGQVGSVQDGAATAVYSLDSHGRYLADTLVARLTDGAGNSANVPPNTVANYSTGTGCGAPWVDDGAPDDSAYIKNLWERPAGELPGLAWHGDTLWASACTMTTRAVVDGDFVEDTVFQAYFLPGAPQVSVAGRLPGTFPYGATAGDTLPFWFGEDAYGNVSWSFNVALTNAVDWAEITATDKGTPALHVLSQPQVGDTLGLTYRTLDGSVLADAVGEVVETTLDGVATWKVGVWERSQYSP